jgi:AraC-like DNA-binding protein
MSEQGRPSIEIDLHQLAEFCKLKPKKEDCAAFFKCSEDTIDRRIKEATGLTFTEFRDQALVHTKFSLMQKAIQEARSGNNVMLIFCLKNMCGWTDKQPGEEDKTIHHKGQVDSNLKVSRIDASDRVKQIKGEQDEKPS